MWPETALVAASDLLDALMSGAAHPIWRYVEEGKSHKRKNKAGASRIARSRQAWVVGILRSLQNDAGLSRRNAAQRLSECAAGIDAAFTADQIIGWDKAFSGHTEGAPDAVRTDLLRLAGDSEENIFKGRTRPRVFPLGATEQSVS